MTLRTLVLMVSLALAGCGALAPRERAPLAQPATLAERHNSLGLALAASGRYGEAVAQFRAAVALEPGAAYLRNNLGFAHLRRGASEEAVSALEEAARLDPAHPQAVVNLAAARAALARSQAARAPVVPPAPVPVAQENGNDAKSDLRLVQVAPHVYELASDVPPAVAARAVVPPAVVHAAPAVPVAAAPQRRYKLEVSNGNGVRGMARRVALHLAETGLSGARTTNDKPFNKPTTEVHYRPGFEQAAKEVAAQVPGGARVIGGRALPNGIDVRIVLGSDRRATVLAQAD